MAEEVPQDLAEEYSEKIRQVDVMMDQVIDVQKQFIETQKMVQDLVRFASQGNNQTVIHKTEGAGGLLVGAIVACFATWVVLIVVTIWAVHEVHDLRAWKDIHQNHISALEKEK